MRLAVALLLGGFSAASPAQVEVEGAWARATAPGAKVAAGYLILHNRSTTPDRLVGASSPAAAQVETHVALRDGDIMRMREVPGYDIPANGRFELKPGGPHLMFTGIRQPFVEDRPVPVTLRFERAGEKTVEFRVGRGFAAPRGQN